MTYKGEASKRTRKMAKDFGIYSIGVLGTRVISFLMLPLYTHYIDKPSDYGYYDLCLTIVMLLVPVITLQLREGAFRFLLTAKDDERRTRITTYIYQTMSLTILLCVAVASMIWVLSPIRFLWLTVILLIVTALHDVVLQISRGLGRNVVYVQGSIITTLLVALLSIYFVVYLDKGIAGIFWANILAHAGGIAYNELRVRTLCKYFKWNSNAHAIGRIMLQYCLPMIPMSLCFWLTTSSDRLLIQHFVGFTANGLYAVAAKFSMIVHTLALIFYQSWQETAIKQFKSDDRQSFYNRVFNLYVFVLASIFICYIFLLKLSYGMLVAVEYSWSRNLLYPLGIAGILNALATSFFDPAYQSARETHRALPAIILTAVVSVGCNLVLVPRYGAAGAAITSVISYMFLMLYRLIDTRRYVKLRWSASTWLPALVVLVGAIPFYFSPSPWVDICYMVVALAVMAVRQRNHIRQGLAYLRSFIGR